MAHYEPVGLVPRKADSFFWAAKQQYLGDPDLSEAILVCGFRGSIIFHARILNRTRRQVVDSTRVVSAQTTRRFMMSWLVAPESAIALEGETSQ